MALLSIVVPVYNGEAFLAECLYSALKQIGHKCELLLIDDGSTDRSVDIIRSACAAPISDGRVRLIRIENSGPGFARNVGVRHARGEYVGFLDCDDILLPGYVEEIVSTIQSFAPDIVQFNIHSFKSDTLGRARKILCHHRSAGIFNLADVRGDIFARGKWFPVSRVFRKHILVDFPFPTDRGFYEDWRTLPFIFLGSYRIALLDDALQGYRDNPCSTTHNHRPEDVITLLEFFEALTRHPDSRPLRILRTQVGRAIVYLALELRYGTSSITTVLKSILNTPGRLELAQTLRFADAFFLLAPRAYVAVDALRKRLSRTRRRVRD